MKVGRSLALLAPVLVALLLRGSDVLVLASCAAGVLTIAAGAPADVAIWRRLLALSGPATSALALSLPWWSSTVKGWETPAGWTLAGLCLLAAAAALGAPREGARAACLACGLVLVGLAGWDLMFGTYEAWLENVLITGPLVALGGGLATTIAGLALYPARRSASSLITAS